MQVVAILLIFPDISVENKLYVTQAQAEPSKAWSNTRHAVCFHQSVLLM